jgi:hypothetical protein
MNPAACRAFAASVFADRRDDRTVAWLSLRWWPTASPRCMPTGRLSPLPLRLLQGLRREPQRLLRIPRRQPLAWRTLRTAAQDSPAWQAAAHVHATAAVAGEASPVPARLRRSRRRSRPRAPPHHENGHHGIFGRHRRRRRLASWVPPSPPPTRLRQRCPSAVIPSDCRR